jgi:hypothetical protein
LDNDSVVLGHQIRTVDEFSPATMEEADAAWKLGPGLRQAS